MPTLITPLPQPDLIGAPISYQLFEFMDKLCLASVSGALDWPTNFINKVIYFDKTGWNLISSQEYSTGNMLGMTQNAFFGGKLYSMAFGLGIWVTK